MRIIRRHFLVAGVDLAVSLSMHNLLLMASFVDHVDQAAPRALGRWTTTSLRKETTQRQGRLDSCFPHGGEYDCTRVYWFVCRRRRITAGVGELRDG